MVKVETIELNNIWQTDKRVEDWRISLIPLIEKHLGQSEIKYDSQDLEHQILFRMLTNEHLKLEDAIQEQADIVLERMQKSRISPEKLFCFGWQRGGAGMANTVE